MSLPSYTLLLSEVEPRVPMRSRAAWIGILSVGDQALGAGAGRPGVVQHQVFGAVQPHVSLDDENVSHDSGCAISISHWFLPAEDLFSNLLPSQRRPALVEGKAGKVELWPAWAVAIIDLRTGRALGAGRAAAGLPQPVIGQRALA